MAGLVRAVQPTSIEPSVEVDPTRSAASTLVVFTSRPRYAGLGPSLEGGRRRVPR